MQGSSLTCPRFAPGLFWGLMRAEFCGMIQLSRGDFHGPRPALIFACNGGPGRQVWLFLFKALAPGAFLGIYAGRFLCNSPCVTKEDSHGLRPTRFPPVMGSQTVRSGFSFRSRRAQVFLPVIR